MKMTLGGFIVLVMVAITAGCSSKGDTKDGDVAIEDRGAEGADGAVASGAAGGSDFSSYSLDDPNSPLSRRVIYFEYDSAEITDADQELLTQHAGFLVANPAQHITLEGSTDERGSREYNIGLGERRSSAVQRFFEAEGVSASQINTISYGEERPAEMGHNEAAWSKNRRAVLVY